MSGLIPDWPNAKARQSNSWLSSAQIMGPFTAMSEALHKLGSGVASLGRGLGKGGGGQELPDNETIAEQGQTAGLASVQGYTADTDYVPGKNADGASRTVPMPTAETAASGETVVNRDGGNAFHPDNDLGAPAGSNQRGYVPTPVPRPSAQQQPLDATAPPSVTAPAPGLGSASPQGMPVSSTPRVPTIQSIWPAAPGSQYPAGYGSNPYAGTPKEAIYQRAQRTAAVGAILPTLETDIYNARLKHPGDPQGFAADVDQRINGLLNGNPDRGVAGITDQPTRIAIRAAADQHKQSNLRGILSDMDAKNQRDHFTFATDAVKLNTERLENLAFQGSVWIDPKTGNLGMSPDAQRLLNDNATLRAGLVQDPRQNYTAATANLEAKHQGERVLGKAIIGQVVRNFQTDKDPVAARAALSGAFFGPGSERYSMSLETRRVFFNEGVGLIGDADIVNREAMKADEQATTKRVDEMYSGKVRYNDQEFNALVQQARGYGNRRLADQLERDRPMIIDTQSKLALTGAPRRAAEQGALHATLSAAGTGGYNMQAPVPVPPSAQSMVRDTYHQQAAAGNVPPITKDAAGDMLALVGKHEVRDRDTLYKWLKSGGSDLDPSTNAWCAAAVNTALQHAGIRGTTGDSRFLAASFQNWGQPVDPARGLQRNDVVVLPQGHHGIVAGMHVGMVSNPTIDSAGNVTIVAGNSSNEMREYKVPVSGAIFRRAGSQEGGGPSPNSLLRTKEVASVRTNNPGAQWLGPVARQFGAVSSEKLGQNNAAIFPTPVHGAAAQFSLLDQKYTGMSLRAAIAKWSGGNDPGAYANSIAKEAGVSPDTMITRSLLAGPAGVALAKAQAKWEAGKAFPMSDEQWALAQRWGLGGKVSQEEIDKVAPTKLDTVLAMGRAAPSGPIAGRFADLEARVHQGGFRAAGLADLGVSAPPITAMPSSRGGAVTAAPSMAAPPDGPGLAFSDNPTGWQRRADAIMKYNSQRAEEEAGVLEAKQARGYAIHNDEIDHALDLAENGNNPKVVDRLQNLLAARDVKEGRQPGESYAQRRAAIEAHMVNGTNAHLAEIGMKVLDGMDAQEKRLREDPLAEGANTGFTNRLGDVMAAPGPELMRRGKDILRLQEKYPELGAVSAIRDHEASEVARFLTQGKPEDVGKFLGAANGALGGPANETYRATMAQPEIKTALVGMAGNPDPNRMGLAMAVLDPLWKQDPNAFRSIYGETGLDRLQLWQGMKASFGDQQIAERISAADDPAAKQGRKDLRQAAEKELSISKSRMPDPAVIAKLLKAPAPADDLTAAEMAREYTDTYTTLREHGLSASAAQESAVQRLVKTSWAKSDINNGRLMRFAPEAITTPRGAAYYPELPDRETLGPSRRWMQHQLDDALEEALGPQMTLPTTPVMAGEAAIPQRSWRVQSIIPDSTTEREVRENDPQRPPSYQVMIERNGALELVRGRNNLPLRFHWDTQKAKDEIEADPGFRNRVERARILRQNAINPLGMGL